MIEIQMNKDIREFSPHVLGPFSLRQVVCVLIAAAYVIPLMLTLPFSFTTNAMICVVLAMPVVACGWANVFGLPLEKFFIQAIKVMFMAAVKRKYKTKNIYEEEYEKLDPPKEPLKKSKKSKTIKGYK